VGHREIQRYTSVVTIELPSQVEEVLRGLAATQGRDLRSVLQDAISQYLEAATIIDVDVEGVAMAQTKLIAELPGVSVWSAEDE
jgi:predicted transcriptional regulator